MERVILNPAYANLKANAANTKIAWQRMTQIVSESDYGFLLVHTLRILWLSLTASNKLLFPEREERPDN